MRRFENEEERERLYDAVYQSEFWQTKVKPLCEEMLDRERMRVTLLIATSKSVIQ
jgi:hypothetical protein